MVALRKMVAKVLWGSKKSGGTARPHPLRIFAIFVFRVAYAEWRFQKAAEMRRVDLVETTMAAWARLDAEQRDRFFKAACGRRCGFSRLSFALGCCGGCVTRRSRVRLIRRPSQFRKPTWHCCSAKRLCGRRSRGGVRRRRCRGTTTGGDSGGFFAVDVRRILVPRFDD
jgi:hypothetical protein